MKLLNVLKRLNENSKQKLLHPRGYSFHFRHKKEDIYFDTENVQDLEKMYDFIKKRLYEVIVNLRDKRLEEIVEFNYKDSYVNGLNLEELSPRGDIFEKLYDYYKYLKVVICLKISKNVHNYYANKENLVCKKYLITLEQIKEVIKTAKEDRYPNNESEQDRHKKLKDIDNLIDETIDIFNATTSRKIR